MSRQRTQTSSETRQILATVANETRSYTDPNATYDFAQHYRETRAEGVALRTGGQR